MIEDRHRFRAFLLGKWLDVYPSEDGYYWPETRSGVKFLDAFQCTGVNDRNGDPIWEGDIVREWFDEKPLSRVWTVRWVCAGFTSWPHGYCFTDSQRIEVVGNTVENPELLEA